MSTQETNILHMKVSEISSEKRPMIFSFNGTGNNATQQNEYKEHLFDPLWKALGVKDDQQPAVVYFKGCHDTDVCGFNPLATAFPHISAGAKRVTKAFQKDKDGKDLIDLCALKREFGAGIEITPPSLSAKVNYLLGVKGKKAKYLIDPEGTLRLEGYSRGVTFLYRLTQFLEKKAKDLKLRLFANQHVSGNTELGYGTLKDKVQSLEDCENVETSFALRGTYTKLPGIYGKNHEAFYKQQLPLMHPDKSKSISVPIPSHHYGDFELSYDYMRYELAKDLIEKEYKAEYDIVIKKLTELKDLNSEIEKLEQEIVGINSLWVSKENCNKEVIRLCNEIKEFTHLSSIYFYNLPTKNYLGEDYTIDEFANKHSQQLTALIRHGDKFYFFTNREENNVPVTIELNPDNLKNANFELFKTETAPDKRQASFYSISLNMGNMTDEKKSSELLSLKKALLTEAIASTNDSSHEKQCKSYLNKIEKFEQKKINILKEEQLRNDILTELTEKNEKNEILIQKKHKREALTEEVKKKEIKDHLSIYKDKILKNYNDNPDLFNLFVNPEAHWFLKSYGQEQKEAPDEFFIEALDAYCVKSCESTHQNTGLIFPKNEEEEEEIKQIREKIKQVQDNIKNKTSDLDLETKKALVNLIALYSDELGPKGEEPLAALRKLDFLLGNGKESKKFIELINTRMQNLALTKAFISSKNKKKYIKEKHLAINENTREFITDSYLYLKTLTQKAREGTETATLSHKVYAQRLRQNVSALKKLGFDKKANRFLDYTVFFFLKNILGFPYHLYKFCKTKDLRIIFLPERTSSEKSLDLSKTYLEKISHPDALEQAPKNAAEPQSLSTNPHTIEDPLPKEISPTSKMRSRSSSFGGYGLFSSQGSEDALQKRRSMSVSPHSDGANTENKTSINLKVELEKIKKSKEPSIETTKEVSSGLSF